MVDENNPFIERTKLECREVEELVDSYLDGELPTNLAVRYDEHLCCCVSCAELVSDLRSVLTIAKTLAEHPVPAPVRSRLRDALNRRFGLRLEPEPRKLRLIKSS